MTLFLKRLFFFLSPFILVIAIFVIRDPYKIFWHYDDYYEDSRISKNRGFISAEVYINQKDKYQYDSFIFGNSRSFAFHKEEWEKYLPEGSSIFHFDAYGETISGLYHKVKYVDEHQGKLNNALLVIDRQVLNRTEGYDYTSRTAPVLMEYKNIIPFVYDHFKVYVDPKRIYAFLDFYITGEYKDYMDKYVLPRVIECRKESNEFRRDQMEAEISKGTFYTEKRLKLFENRQHPDSLMHPVINDQRKKYLQETALIFQKHHTSFKIVISPLYDQIRLNPEDLLFLQNTFGENNIFDFSGPNEWNSDYRNFYENSHYRTHVANELLKIVYKPL